VNFAARIVLFPISFMFRAPLVAGDTINMPNVHDRFSAVKMGEDRTVAHVLDLKVSSSFVSSQQQRAHI